MPRQFKKTKPYIVVFCEGETEQAYTEFLKKKFKDAAVIKYPKETGLFDVADNKFKKDINYRGKSEVTDEIWFFYDVEQKDISEWNNRLKIIKKLRKLRTKPNIKVRLLMTTGCIEYWLMLHYEFFVPPIITPSEKDNIIKKLVAKEPNYKKGDADVISKISQNYEQAVVNAKKTVFNLLQDGLPGLDDTDERNQWLCANSKTFSTVYEAIDFLNNI